MGPTSAILAESSARIGAEVPFWIGGVRTPSHGTRRGEVTNPSTGQVVRHVLLADATGSFLRPGAAPSLPPEYVAAINPVPIALGRGSSPASLMRQ